MSEMFKAGTPLDRVRGSESLTDFDRKVAASLNNPGVHIFLLDAFKEYLTQYQALNQTPIPISQIFGFDQFTVRGPEYVGTVETTTSTSYTDLATAGPELTGLSAGTYLVFFGASSARSSVAGTQLAMSVRVNSTEATDTNAASTATADYVPLARATAVELDQANNTLTARYRTTGAATAEFAGRWLLALKTANL